jgi:hypothetical protein
MLPPDVKAAHADVDVTAWPKSFLFLQLLLTAVVALGLRDAEPVEAIAVGPFLVYVWLVVNAYYWNMMMLPALAWMRRDTRDRLVPLLGLHAMLIWFYVYQHLSHGFAEGYFMGLLTLVNLLLWSVLSMKPWRASASRKP